MGWIPRLVRLPDVDGRPVVRLGRRHLVPLVRCAALWGVRGHAFATPRVGSGCGMVLFGLGQSWAQSHESATPTYGGHADTELAVTRPRPPVTWPRAERGSRSHRHVARGSPT